MINPISFQTNLDDFTVSRNQRNRFKVITANNTHVIRLREIYERVNEYTADCKALQQAVKRVSDEAFLVEVTEERLPNKKITTERRSNLQQMIDREKKTSKKILETPLDDIEQSELGRKLVLFLLADQNNSNYIAINSLNKITPILHQKQNIPLYNSLFLSLVKNKEKLSERIEHLVIETVRSAGELSQFEHSYLGELVALSLMICDGNLVHKNLEKLLFLEENDLCSIYTKEVLFNRTRERIFARSILNNVEEEPFLSQCFSGDKEMQASMGAGLQLIRNPNQESQESQDVEYYLTSLKETANNKQIDFTIFDEWFNRVRVLFPSEKSLEQVSEEGSTSQGPLSPSPESQQQDSHSVNPSPPPVAGPGRDYPPPPPIVMLGPLQNRYST